jgi:hypothetical protein
MQETVGDAFDPANTSQFGRVFANPKQRIRTVTAQCFPEKPHSGSLGREVRFKDKDFFRISQVRE